MKMYKKNIFLTRFIIIVFLLTISISKFDFKSLAQGLTDRIIEISEPVEIHRTIINTFEKKGISDLDNLLMVGSFGELNLQAAGNYIGGVKDDRSDYNAYYLCYESEEDLNSAKQSLETNSSIKYIDKNVRIETDKIINEDNSPNVLNKTATDQEFVDDNGVKGINIRNATKNLSKDREALRIGIIDHGIDKGHPYFLDGSGNLKKNIEFDKKNVFLSKNDDLVSTDGPIDTDGHGTMVAGIIANSLENINYTIIPYKVFEDDNSTSLIQLINAFKRAVAQRCDVINIPYSFLSYSHLFGEESETTEFLNLINEALKNGTTVVTSLSSASHVLTEKQFAEIKDIMTVGSAKFDYRGSQQEGEDKNDISEEEKDYFPVNISKSSPIYDKDIDFYAPGRDVVTTSLYDPDNGKDGYVCTSSTTIASAYVAAMCAAYKVIGKYTTPSSIKKDIREKGELLTDGMSKFARLVDYIDVYRLYNKSSCAHYYTTSRDEVERKCNYEGWTNEYARWTTPRENVYGTIPIYKVYNEKLDKWLFTKRSEAEKLVNDKKSGWIIHEDSLDKKGNWKIAFYSYGSEKIYRLYNPNNGDHLLTISKNEYDKLEKLGWKGEEVKMNSEETFLESEGKARW